jgi:hypothetical protein
MNVNVILAFIFRIEQDVTTYMSSAIILTSLVRHIIKIFFNIVQWRVGSLSVIFERNIYECYLKRNTTEWFVNKRTFYHL